jgi:hypothetical protein
LQCRKIDHCRDGEYSLSADSGKNDVDLHTFR